MTNSRKSTKFNEAMETGQFKNPELLTAPAYPWNIQRSGGSPENYSNSNNANPDVRSYPTPYASFSREGQTIDQHHNSEESHQQLLEQTEHSERVHSGFQSPPSTNNNAWELFDVGVQVGDTVPSLHMWEPSV